MPNWNRESDIHLVDLQLYFLPIQTRMPLKFGSETLTQVHCARVQVTVENRGGHRAVGWGETPLSIQWVWPSDLAYDRRLASVQDFTRLVAGRLLQEDHCGHAFELGWQLLQWDLPQWLEGFNHDRQHPLPYLASLLVASAFDLALHDAQGQIMGLDTYATYQRSILPRPLGDFLEADVDSEVDFSNRFLDDYLLHNPPPAIPVWHLVGGLDPLAADQANDSDPDDGYPVLLADWIRRDGLQRLKVKLRGNDEGWDYQRLIDVGQLAVPLGVTHLSADFNCTVQDPEYVLRILERMERDQPLIWQRLAYVEQPFPYDLEQWPVDVHQLAARKPLYLDESAHDWQHVRLGRALGWNGVALKTCKTQTGALLSLCWARAHGMGIMVQDLTNPMLAQIPHVRLAAHAGTVWGVESNAMQYYPEASQPESSVHPGLYQRRDGQLDLSSLGPLGFGYRVDEIPRQLPPPVALDRS